MDPHFKSVILTCNLEFWVIHDHAITLRTQYPEITWKKVTGMRDRLAHDYFGIELQTVWDTTQQDLPLLRPVIQAMLNQLEHEVQETDQP